MGKRKWSDGDGEGVDVVVKKPKKSEDATPTTKEKRSKKKRSSPNDGGHKFDSLMKKQMEKLKNYSAMSYSSAKRLIASDKKCGLIEISDQRHLTVSWHQTGTAFKAVKYILNCSIGRYRADLKGVVLAIGKTELLDNPRVVADQPCMHMDIIAKTIVFRPKIGHAYKCVITGTDQKFIIARLHQSIPFLAPKDDVKNEAEMSVGDDVMIKLQEIDVKGGMCRMKGTVMAS